MSLSNSPTNSEITQSKTSNLGAYEVTKQVCDRVKQILKKIEEISRTHPDIGLNPTSEELIKFSIER